MPIFLSPKVREKLLTKHNVTEAQVIQCFANRVAGSLLDTRAEHLTSPPTSWFIAETDHGIKLKVCYVFDPDSKLVEIKTAYKANEEEIRIYQKHAKRPGVG
jgi:hypothetical protein